MLLNPYSRIALTNTSHGSEWPGPQFSTPFLDVLTVSSTGVVFPPSEVFGEKPWGLPLSLPLCLDLLCTMLFPGLASFIDLHNRGILLQVTWSDQDRCSNQI